MNEDIIIQSEQYNTKKYLIIIFIISAALVVIGICLYAINFDECRSYPSYHGGYRHVSLWANIRNPYYSYTGLSIDLGILTFAITAITAIIGWWLSSYQLTVTDKRIFGVTSWGKRVDLPLDSVSAVSSSSLKGIAIATSSGRIVFKCIKNRDAIYEAVNTLLISRQKTNEKNNVYSEKSDSLEELSKLKELLDTDVITSDEFEAKKKQVLKL